MRTKRFYVQMLLLVLTTALLTACAPTKRIAPTSAPTSIRANTPALLPASTNTPKPTATATIEPTSTLIPGINLLTPKDFALDPNYHLLSIITYEYGAKPDTSAIKRGLTFGRIIVDPVHNDDYVISVVTFYSPGAGAAATQRAMNGPADEFPICTEDTIESCTFTMDQLMGGNFGRWAQKKFGDKDHLAKVVVFPGFTDYKKRGVLKSGLKRWKTNEVFLLITNNILGGISQFQDDVVTNSLRQNPDMFNMLQNFANSGNPEDIDGDTIIYEVPLPEG